MKALLVSALCAGAALQAQAVKEYDFHLQNGAEVLYQTYGQAGANLGTARAFGNMIERNVMDEKNTRQLGFRLQIEKLPGDPVRFRVSMGGPVGDSGGLWGFFGRSAPPRDIQNGDRVMLDVMEETATGRKISDTFQVGIGIGMHTMPATKTIPKAPPPGAMIHLQGPELVAGDVALGKSSSEVSGEAVLLRVPGKGVFSFSTHQEPGYRMEAVAEGNVLMFVTGSDRYDVRCARAVMDGAGSQYLWIRHDDTVNGQAKLPSLDLKTP